MRIIKRKSKQTYKNSKGVEKHFYNYFVENDNGKRIQIKPAFSTDSKSLDMIATYEG